MITRTLLTVAALIVLFVGAMTGCLYSAAVLATFAGYQIAQGIADRNLARQTAGQVEKQPFCNDQICEVCV